ncbi:type VI secretion system baseplate subunit TssG [Pelomonas sp. KK5]|uniref:type VI secretion system baseplate subunit TssG n=1 Tax=Pelomonas sp. KK5 TaxID=1855730 RepID=UPI001E348663|nr:type VI secretion system baseplate subunit TssG [Pelomonas sp. KK5]
MIADDLDPAPPRDFSRWLKRLSTEPYRFDFYQTLRRFESANPQLPRLGEALRPSDEPLRVSQPAELSFAPASIHALNWRPNGVPELSQRIFGLLGPNGPLPLHMTELAGERAKHHGDKGLQRFLDLLNHRFTLLFYRAWAQSQPTLSQDRPQDQQFSRRLGALSGIGSEASMHRDAAGDAAKLHFTGRLARHTRDADGLLNWIRSEFHAPARIEQWCGHWMPLARDERSRLRSLGRPQLGQKLAHGAVLGESVWDVQSKFRIVIGPVREAAYHAFLPGGSDLARLQAMVRQWVGLEYEWDVKLILARQDVPTLRLARTGELGRSCWLGRFKKPGDADDLVIDVERTLKKASRQRTTTS